MEKTRIFISYRREDSSGYAGRIYDRLVTEFGFDQVFFDIDTIPPGDDFVDVLSQKVESCDVLLAVMGKSWLTIADASGRPRIQNPEDFVAIEISAALRRNVRVIPILVGGGRMPGTKELPEALALLARRQAHELPDKGFVPALEKLFPVLRNTVSVAPPAQSGRTKADIQSAIYPRQHSSAHPYQAGILKSKLSLPDIFHGQLNSPEGRFVDQLKSLPQTALVTKILAMPRWRILIRPVEFMEAQFKDRTALPSSALNDAPPEFSDLTRLPENLRRRRSSPSTTWATLHLGIHFHSTRAQLSGPVRLRQARQPQRRMCRLVVIPPRGRG